MNKLVVLFMVAMLCMCILTACKKCISKDYETETVKIVDEYHRGHYVTPVRCGKSFTMVSHPAVYRITVEYEGNKYSINDEETYMKYSTKIDSETKAIFYVKTYDDGSKKYYLDSIE